MNVEQSPGGYHGVWTWLTAAVAGTGNNSSNGTNSSSRSSSNYNNSNTATVGAATGRRGRSRRGCSGSTEPLKFHKCTTAGNHMRRCPCTCISCSVLTILKPPVETAGSSAGVSSSSYTNNYASILHCSDLL